jgi:4-hydroxybenzoate polyprenyltransferase
MIIVSVKLVEYIKLIRLPGWGGYCITAVFGAITVGVLDLLSLTLLFIIGAFVTLYGFVLNDYIDVATDNLSEELTQRPLVKGSIPRLNALYISISGIIIAYIIIILSIVFNIFIQNIVSLFVFTVAVLFAAIYNVYGKKFPGSDVFVAGATAIYCVFGALAVSKSITNLTWIVTIVTFFQVLYLNAIIGGLKDADHDYKLGVKNIALTLGVTVKEKHLIIPLSFKILALLIRSSSLIFIFIPIFVFTDFVFEPWQPIIMIVMFIGVFYSTIKMINLKKFIRNDLRKLISIQAFLRYSIVPVMLLSLTGYYLGIFLIFFPVLWYITFNKILYGSASKPETL